MNHYFTKSPIVFMPVVPFPASPKNKQAKGKIFIKEDLSYHAHASTVTLKLLSLNLKL